MNMAIYSMASSHAHAFCFAAHLVWRWFLFFGLHSCSGCNLYICGGRKIYGYHYLLISNFRMGLFRLLAFASCLHHLTSFVIRPSIEGQVSFHLHPLYPSQSARCAFHNLLCSIPVSSSLSPSVSSYTVIYTCSASPMSIMYMSQLLVFPISILSSFPFLSRA